MESASSILELGVILLAAVAARAVPTARPLQLAVGLGQIGEFSFVLASALVAGGVIPGTVYVAMVGAVAVSIAASAVLVRLVPTTGRGAAPAAG